MPRLFTIGYATKPITVFVQQLKASGIDMVADVRSVPYSKVFHDYHREPFKHYLAQHKIGYVYLGDELGPRSKNDEHYNEQQVQFDRLMASELFISGIDRLKMGMHKDYTIALTCAEKDPAICHRSLLIGYYLQHHQDMECKHILHDGTIETQNELESRLMSETNILPDFISSQEECQIMAYQTQCSCYAYKRD